MYQNDLKGTSAGVIGRGMKPTYPLAFFWSDEPISDLLHALSGSARDRDGTDATHCAIRELGVRTTVEEGIGVDGPRRR